MSVEYTFESFDGIKLYGKTDAIDNPRAVIVIVHGLCEHQGRYDYLTMRLNAQGYSVYRFDHRGHGRSEGQKIFYSDFQQIAKDVDVVVEHAMEENPFSPIFIIGHSMGGFASALYGTMFPNKVDGFVLSGAWTRDNKGLTLAAVEADADDLTYIPNELGDGVCSDPAVGRAYVADPYVIMEMSLGLFREVNKGQKWMKENAAEFVDPVILLHGADDALVDVTDSLDFFQEIGSADKSLRVYSGLMHEIFNEYDKDSVIKDALDWLGLHASLVSFDYEELFEEIFEEELDEEDED